MAEKQPNKEQHRRFLLWLGVGNVLLGLMFVALTYFFVPANCSGEICDAHANQLALGIVTTIVSADFTAISLYFSIRFWRR